MNKIKILFNSREENLQEVRAKLHDFPHSFDRTLEYIVEKFGKYLPYIVSDPEYMQLCHDACKYHFGFVPEYYLEFEKPAGFYDMDDDSYADVVQDIPWAYEQLEFSQIPITTEGGAKEWS